MYLYLTDEEVTNLRFVLNHRIVALYDTEIAYIIGGNEELANITRGFREGLEKIEEQLKIYWENERRK